MTQRSESGSGLIEVVVASAIVALVAVAFVGTFATLSQFHQRDTLTIKGQLLAEEGLEAILLMKGSGWETLSNLPKDEDEYLSLSSSWGTTSTPEIVGGVFHRSFRLASVVRDGSDNIIPSGGSVDSGTLLATVVVSWAWKGATSTVTYKTYVTSI
ncbi:MAG: hypothetical protein WC763_03665 [Candidatus Paceibacterota bacterium]|jgi:type II secretory pathway pseudopilin PulG